MIKTKSVWIVFVLSLAADIACAAKLSPLNTDFFENPKKIEKVALLVDVLITADITGKIDGIYRADYNRLMPIIGDAIKEEVEDHGFVIAESHANAGLFAPSDLKLVYAEHDKSTGEAVVFPFYDPNPPEWARQPLQTLMNSVLSAVKSTRSESHVTVAIPEELKKLPVDAIVVLNISSIDVPMAKTLGISIATGLVTAGIATGLGVSPVYGYLAFNSGGTAMVTMIDLRDGNVLWHQVGQHPGRGSNGGTTQIRPVVARLLKALPYRNGKPHFTAVSQNEKDSKDDESASSESSDVSDDDAEENTAKNSAAVAQSSTTLKSSIFADANGWSMRDARHAYYAGEISAADYKAFGRKCKLEFRQARKDLDQAVRDKKINKHERDLEDLKLQWLYRGF